MCRKNLCVILGGVFILIAVAAPAADTVYFQWDFEATNGGFQSSRLPGQDGWEWGVPTDPDGPPAYSGIKLWGTNLSSELPDYQATYELRVNVTLPQSPSTGLFLKWWDWFGVDGEDTREVQVEIGDDTTTIWATAGQFGDPTQPYWQYQQADISQWAGSNVDIVFVLYVCCQPPGIEGWYIDDVSIVGAEYSVWHFEFDDGGFTADQYSSGGDWEWGDPTYPSELTAAHSGFKVWGTKLDGPALEGGGQIHDLRREIGVHPGGAVLRWWDWNKDESLNLVDYRSVNVDDGIVWTELMNEMGNQLVWKRHQIDLSPWAGQRVDVVFRLYACCTDPGPDGWYIDDVQLAPPSIFDDGFESGDLTTWSSSVP